MSTIKTPILVTEKTPLMSLPLTNHVLDMSAKPRTNINSILVLAGLTMALHPLAAAGPDLTKLPPPAVQTGVTYAADIRPILQASCFNCHGQQRQRGGLRLDSLEAALRGGDDGTVITPGKSKDSLLVLAVAQLDEETAMPPKRSRGDAGGPGGRRPGGKTGDLRGQGGGRGPGGANGPGGSGAMFGRR